MSETEQSQYYIIKFETFIEMVAQIDHSYNIIATLLKENINLQPIENWSSAPIPELCGYFAALSEIKIYLDDIINNPTEEETDIIIKNNIKDVLISISDLHAIDVMMGAIQEYENRLQEKHGITTNIQ